MTARACGRCRQNPATNPRGQAVCASCRLLCRRCDGALDALGYCRPCNRRYAKERPLKIKNCVTCGVEFRSKAAPNYCNRCMHERKKHPCADCGVQVDARAKRCMPCWGKAHAGENGTQFKEGRSRNKYHGYVILTGYRGHPRASASGQLKEHVLVMEKMVGRYLLPNENVHHKNGVRDDNRPENLELWTRSQPAGQRTSDMVAWAKELLALYEPEALALTVTPVA